MVTISLFLCLYRIRYCFTSITIYNSGLRSKELLLSYGKRLWIGPWILAQLKLVHMHVPFIKVKSQSVCHLVMSSSLIYKYFMLILQNSNKYPWKPKSQWKTYYFKGITYTITIFVIYLCIYNIHIYTYLSLWSCVKNCILFIWITSCTNFTGIHRYKTKLKFNDSLKVLLRQED